MLTKNEGNYWKNPDTLSILCSRGEQQRTQSETLLHVHKLGGVLCRVTEALPQRPHRTAPLSSRFPETAPPGRLTQSNPGLSMVSVPLSPEINTKQPSEGRPRSFCKQGQLRPSATSRAQRDWGRSPARLGVTARWPVGGQGICVSPEAWVSGYLKLAGWALSSSEHG